jgi:signal transduction histidine kinase
LALYECRKTNETAADKDDKNEKNWVIVNVKDTGRGIDVSILPRLFTKFASKSYQGTGLGLFISKGIVEAHLGEIRAKTMLMGKERHFHSACQLI